MSFHMETVFWHKLLSLCNTVVHDLHVAVHFSVIQVSQLSTLNHAVRTHHDPPAPPFSRFRHALSKDLSRHHGVSRNQVLQHVFDLTLAPATRNLQVIK